MAPTVDLFLEITDPASGIDGPIDATGESEDATHPKTMELLSADLGLSNVSTVGSVSAGAGAGKSHFEALKITMLFLSTR